jgi:transmembrane sensor
VPDQSPHDAVAWFVKRRIDRSSPADERAFAAWLAAEEGRAEAYREVERSYAFAAHALDGRKSSGRPAERRPARVWAAAASFAAIALIVAASVPMLWTDAYRTQAGERRIVTLNDGSTVHLNGATRISVKFDAHTRTIDLLAGEALFEVAKDPDKPFRVHAGGRVVQAVGTAFDIDLGTERVDVAVSEGTVLVLPSAKPEGAATPLESIQLPKGNAVSYSADGRSGPVRPVAADTVGAWRRDLLIFADDPIAKILVALSRHYGGVFTTSDRRLDDRRFTGTITLRDRAQTLRFLEQALSVQVRDLGNDRFEFVSAARRS